MHARKHRVRHHCARLRHQLPHEKPIKRQPLHVTGGRLHANVHQKSVGQHQLNDAVVVPATVHHRLAAQRLLQPLHARPQLAASGRHSSQPPAVAICGWSPLVGQLHQLSPSLCIVQLAGHVRCIGGRRMGCADGRGSGCGAASAAATEGESVTLMRMVAECAKVRAADGHRVGARRPEFRLAEQRQHGWEGGVEFGFGKHGVRDSLGWMHSNEVRAQLWAISEFRGMGGRGGGRHTTTATVCKQSTSVVDIKWIALAGEILCHDQRMARRSAVCNKCAPLLLLLLIRSALPTECGCALIQRRNALRRA